MRHGSQASEASRTTPFGPAGQSYLENSSRNKLPAGVERDRRSEVCRIGQLAGQSIRESRVSRMLHGAGESCGHVSGGDRRGQFGEDVVQRVEIAFDMAPVVRQGQ